MPTPPPFSWKLVILSLLAGRLLWWIAGRMTTTRHTLRWIIVLSFGVRVGLAVALYAISYWQWPILKSLQLGDGFWALATDARTYHYISRLIAESWQHGLAWPSVDLGIAFFAFVAGIYWLLGAHPLYPIVVNCALAASTGLIAYAMSRPYASERGAIRVAALVSWWPSTFIWSAQLLKDTLCSWAVFVTLWLIVGLVPQAEPGRRRMPGAVGAVALVGLVMLLTWLRFYLGPALALATAVAFSPALLASLWHRAPKRALRYAALIGLVGAATILANTINPLRLITPRHPDRARRSLATPPSSQPNVLMRASASTPVSTTSTPPRLPAGIETEPVTGQETGGAPETAPPAHDMVLAPATQPLTKPSPTTPTKLRPAKAIPWVQRAASTEGFRDTSAVAVAPPAVSAHAVMPQGEPAPVGGQVFSKSPTITPAPKISHPAVRRFVYQAHRVSQFGRPEPLRANRQTFIEKGGNSLVDPHARIGTLPDMLRYLPRALLIGFFAPFPSQWFDAGGSTGSMRLLAAGEMCLLYVLMPAILMGMWSALTHRHPAQRLVLGFVLSMAIPLSLTVANLGTLFRLRLTYLLPLWVLAGAGSPWEPYRRMFRWLSRRRPAGSGDDRPYAAEPLVKISEPVAS